MSFELDGTIPDWVGAISNAIIALSALVAAWKYLRVFNVPLIVELSDHTSGQSYDNGKLVSDNYGWLCKLKNNSAAPVHIRRVELQRRRYWFFWARTKQGDAPRAGPLPASISPGSEFELWLLREKKESGSYRLLIWEYGSMRRGAIPLLEVSKQA